MPSRRSKKNQKKAVVRKATGSGQFHCRKCDELMNADMKYSEYRYHVDIKCQGKATANMKTLKTKKKRADKK